MAERSPRTPSWTTEADILRTLRRRWDSGALLARFAAGMDWEPLGLPLSCPSAGQLAEDFGAVQSWVRKWQATKPHLLRVEYKQVGGRAVGANRLPCRVWVEGYRQMWQLLGVEDDVERFTVLLDTTRQRAPELAAWMTRKPMRVLDVAADWPKLVDVVTWIDAHGHGEMYLRQVDVPGVDTKFIENHRQILATLLDVRLDETRIDRDRPSGDLAGRYRFRTKPDYVRLRSLDPTTPLFGRFSELSTRADELVADPPTARTVYLVENEITYLAFPEVRDAIVVLGAGYGLSRLEPVSWLRERELFYWGDIDTHGFAILNQLRHGFGHARSILMDRQTLLAHRSHWGSEPRPVNANLEHLDPDEAELYHDLVEDTFGHAVRLEQERVSYSAIKQALHPAIR